MEAEADRIQLKHTLPANANSAQRLCTRTFPMQTVPSSVTPATHGVMLSSMRELLHHPSSSRLYRASGPLLHCLGISCRSGLIYNPSSQACLFENRRGASGANHRRLRSNAGAMPALTDDSDTQRDVARKSIRDTRDEVAILRQRVDEQSKKLDAILALLHAQMK